MKRLVAILAVPAFALLAWQSEPPPAIGKDGVVNSASRMPPEFGGGQIARGSVFLIRGWRLGPDPAVRAEKFPLEGKLAGISVEIRAAGVNVNAYPLSVSSNEIEAVLPSEAPLGKVELVVRKDGDPSPPLFVYVVESSFGAYSINGLGWGPAKSQIGSASARPGQTITLEGTGLGVTGGPDNRQPQRREAHGRVSITAGGKPVAKIRYAGRSACCSGTDELSFDLPVDTPEGCYVPLRVESGPGIVSNIVTVAVNRSGAACQDPGNWLPRELDGARRVGIAGLLNADVLLSLERKEASFNFDAGFARFVAVPAGPPQISPSYLFPPYGACTGYNRIVHGGEMLSTFSSMSVVAGVAIDAGRSLTVRSGEQRRSLGRSSGTDKGYAAVLGGRSPFPGTPPSALFLRPQTFEISGEAEAVGSFRAPVKVSAPVRWTNRWRVTSVDRRRGVKLDWTPAQPGDSMLITALNIDAKSGALGVCECLAKADAGHFTVPAAALTNIPANRESGSLPLNLLMISEFPGQSPQPFTAPGLDRAFAFFFSTSARSVVFR